MKKFFIRLLFIAFVIGVHTVQASDIPCIDFKDNLVRGDENDDVLLLQNFLVYKKFLHVTPNGYFGPATFSATRLYQKSKGLSRSGAVFPLTRAGIKGDTCNQKTNTQAGIDDSMNTRNRDSAQATTSAETIQYSTTSAAEVFSREIAMRNIDISMEKNQKAVSLSNNMYTSFPVNARYIKLGTVALMTKTNIHIVSLSFFHTMASNTPQTLSNFTITDGITGKITNTWPLFVFPNEVLSENQVKMYELYANSADLPQGTTTKDVIFSGYFTVKESNATSTNVIDFPSFRVSVSK